MRLAQHDTAELVCLLGFFGTVHIVMIIVKVTNQLTENLPVSQSFPVQPEGQVQTYFPYLFVHVPPFLHGLLSHSLMSVEKD